jgi:hypothetical protein
MAGSSQLQISNAGGRRFAVPRIDPFLVGWFFLRYFPPRQRAPSVSSPPERGYSSQGLWTWHGCRGRNERGHFRRLRPLDAFATKRYRFPYRLSHLSFLFVLLNNVLSPIPAASPRSTPSSSRLFRYGFRLELVRRRAALRRLMLSKAQKRVAGRTLIPYQSVLVTLGALVGAGNIAAIADTYL